MACDLCEVRQHSDVQNRYCLYAFDTTCILIVHSGEERVFLNTTASRAPWPPRRRRWYEGGPCGRPRATARSNPPRRAPVPGAVVVWSDRTPRLIALRIPPAGPGARSRDAGRGHDERMSRQHARLTWAGDQVRVADLGSRNGTHVGGRQIASIEVAAPAPTVVRVGRTVLIAVADVRASRARAVSPTAASSGRPCAPRGAPSSARRAAVARCWSPARAASARSWRRGRSIAPRA
jgi:hypothetical protein